MLTELEEVVLEEGVELEEGVVEPGGRVVLELWEAEDVEDGGVETEEGGVAEEVEDDDMVVVMVEEEPDAVVVAEFVTSGWICAGVFVVLF